MAPQSLNDIIDNLNLTYHLENSDLGIILWSSELKMIYTSPKAQQIFEWEQETFNQNQFTIEGFVHKEDIEEVLELIADITSGKVLHNQSVNRNYTASGKLLYCQWYNSALKDDSGHLINMLSLVQDITEQTNTSISLQASEHQLSLVFEGAIDPMWVIIADDTSRFRFETVNTAFTTVTGWKKKQVEGQPIELIMPPSSHDLVREKYKEAIEHGKIVDYVEEAEHPSGIKYGEIRIIPIRNEAGTVTRLLGIANDITEKIYLQKKLDTELKNLNKKITAAAIKSQELERASVSRELHDNVNQVLTTVKLYIELCMDGKIEQTKVLPKSAELLNETINEIRNLSKQLSAPAIGKINFKETLGELALSVSTAAQIKINLNIGMEECTEMDEDLHLTIYRIVQEQLTNISKHAKASVVNIALDLKDQILHLTIEDNGIGFDTKQKSKGIGFTNMHSRTEILGGTFEVESDLKRGTKIITRFPVKMIDEKCFPAEFIDVL